MHKNDRRDEIYDILLKEGETSVTMLAKRLYTSESSIRRDLRALGDLGIIKRTHGGARAHGAASSVIPFKSRSYSAVKEKRLIAEKAIKLINDGDTVFLDQSSTSYFLALELLAHSPLTVITNNLEILSLLSSSKHTLISTGGVVSKHNTNCLIGREAARGFENVFADIAFFSSRAMDIFGTVSDCTSEEIAVREAMLKNAKKAVLLLDSTKFGTRSVFKQCSLGDVYAIVSDKTPDELEARFPSVRFI